MDRNSPTKLDYHSLGFVYMYNKIFNDKEIAIQKILKPGEVKDRMNICSEDFKKLSKSGDNKYILMKIQTTLLNIYKKLANSIREKTLKNMSEEKDPTAIEKSYIDNLEYIKGQILKNEKMNNHISRYIEFDKTNFNSLLKIDMNTQCNLSSIFELLYYCSVVIYVICLTITIIPVGKIGIFDSYNSRYDSIIYIIARLNDNLEPKDRFY